MCVCVCAQVLDRLLLYLRLVHSVDYYNFCEYPAEDEMPHRCGLIHVRGPLPTARIASTEGSTNTHTHCVEAKTLLNALSLLHVLSHVLIRFPHVGEDSFGVRLALLSKELQAFGCVKQMYLLNFNINGFKNVKIKGKSNFVK